MQRTDVLQRIVERKREEVAEAKSRVSFQELEARVAQAEPPRNFFAAVAQHPTRRHISIIAEIKRRSPSAGLLRPEYADDSPPESPNDAGNEGGETDKKAGPPGEHVGCGSGGAGRVGGFDPAAVARRYALNGAVAISCLTDGPDFGGRLEYIERIKSAVSLPVLRKDFLIDPWQLWESRAAGADAVLLIAECLREGELIDLLILAQQLQMTTLLEVHSLDSLLRVRPHIGFPHPAYGLLGVNNRDLSTMKVDLNHILRMLDMVENLSTLVCESGIRSRADIERLANVGIRSFLVGENLMRQSDPGAALAELLDRPVR